MCGSTTASRNQAFVAALAVFSAAADVQQVPEGAVSSLSERIKFVADLGGPNPPEFVATHAKLEDAVTKAVRAVQISQRAIIEHLLNEGTVSANGQRVHDLVADLNNLKAAQDAAEAQAVIVEAEFAKEEGQLQ